MRTMTTLATGLLIALLTTRAGADSSTVERAVLTIDAGKRSLSRPRWRRKRIRKAAPSQSSTKWQPDLPRASRRNLPGRRQRIDRQGAYGRAVPEPTAAFEEIIKGDRTPMIALADFAPLQGGVPIVIGGKVIAAIGVSGAASQVRDEAIAKAGAAALQ